jgi:uncharacterized protein YhhL (DUF1145 family)
MPFLIILYSLIRGLGYTVAKGVKYTNSAGQNVTCHPGGGAAVCAAPRYIPVASKMHQNLVSSLGQMHSFFGMDLSATPFTHHGADQAALLIPYLVLIGLAILMQYYQMKQMNSRNPQAAAANPQMQQMQKFFPIIFGVIYLRVPAGATIYMVVSSAMRIGTQDIMFRTGYVTPPVAEREIGPGTKAAKVEKAEKPEIAPPPPKKPKPSTVTDGTGSAARRGTTPPKKSPTNGNVAPNDRRPNGRKPAAANGNNEEAPETKAHPRSRSKRTRKAR